MVCKRRIDWILPATEVIPLNEEPVKSVNGPTNGTLGKLTTARTNPRGRVLVRTCDAERVAINRRRGARAFILRNGVILSLYMVTYACDARQVSTRVPMYTFSLTLRRHSYDNHYYRKEFSKSFIQQSMEGSLPSFVYTYILYTIRVHNMGVCVNVGVLKLRITYYRLLIFNSQ